MARGLSASLDAHKRRYAEMVREAYRNYKHNNYLTYLFSSSDFNQVARRITTCGRWRPCGNGRWSRS